MTGLVPRLLALWFPHPWARALWGLGQTWAEGRVATTEGFRGPHNARGLLPLPLVGLCTYYMGTQRMAQPLKNSHGPGSRGGGTKLPFTPSEQGSESTASWTS